MSKETDSERFLQLLSNRVKYGTAYPERAELLEQLIKAVECYQELQPEAVKQVLEKINSIKLSA